MTFAQGVIVGCIPVVLGWMGMLVWLLVSDHSKHRLHDERWNQLTKEVAALASMAELNNKIIIARGWANLTVEVEEEHERHHRD